MKESDNPVTVNLKASERLVALTIEIRKLKAVAKEEAKARREEIGALEYERDHLASDMQSGQLGLFHKQAGP